MEFLDGFRRTILWAYDEIGKGAQKKIAEGSGIAASYLSRLTSGINNGTEVSRRSVVAAINNLLKTNFTYEEFVSFGEHLLAGNSVEEWKNNKTIGSTMSKMYEDEILSGIYALEILFPQRGYADIILGNFGGEKMLCQKLENKSDKDVILLLSEIEDFLDSLIPGWDSSVAKIGHLGWWFQKGNSVGKWLENRANKYQDFDFQPLVQLIKDSKNITSKIVPVVNWASLDRFFDTGKVGFDHDILGWTACSSRTSSSTFGLIVRGDSMEPEFFDGETIIVDPSVLPETGKFVVVSFRSEDNDLVEPILRQYIRDPENIFLKSKNNNYPMLNVAEQQFRVCGCVVEKNKRY